MNIIIEVGDNETRPLIQQELEDFANRFVDLRPTLPVSKIIIPYDFEEKVREFEGNDSFKANRGLETNGMNTIAKICKDGSEYAIVASSVLYTERYDTLIRYFILTHEFVHVLNKFRFPPISSDSYVKELYTSNLYNFYDEYYADRAAYFFCDNLFQEKSPIWNKWLEDEVNGFLGLAFDLGYFCAIKSEIDAFRLHTNLDLFLSRIQPIFDVVFISLSHLYAIHHSYPGAIDESSLIQSKFINQKTFDFAAYMKRKFEDKSLDLSDGLESVCEFMTNFGVKFEHRDYGGYCYVLDI